MYARRDVETSWRRELGRRLRGREKTGSLCQGVEIHQLGAGDDRTKLDRPS